jgi:glycosyltransferase involved in cell wall biosynthesis
MIVVPSIYEPFGYAAVEAMAAGKPVVASNTGGLAEIIEDEKSGLLVPLVPLDAQTGIYDVDVSGLVSAQLRICEDPELAGRLGERARERILALFNVDQMVEGTLKIYSKIVESQKLLRIDRDDAVGCVL